MLEGLWTLENLIALITLAELKIVLGIDNIIFVMVVTDKLPRRSVQRPDGGSSFA